MSHSVIGLDIAKSVFHVYTIQADGKVLKKMLRRQQVLEFFANYPVSLIGIEACGSSHYWARELIALGPGRVKTSKNLTTPHFPVHFS